jgi:AbrB family looped-hinge helix DNA binding protein
MQAITTVVKVDSIGRVIIPKHVRDALKIGRGDLVKITVQRESVQVGDIISDEVPGAQ